MIAAFQQLTPILKTLLEAGANVQLQQRDGVTVLIVSAGM
jgi:hypothetical protein